MRSDLRFCKMNRKNINRREEKIMKSFKSRFRLRTVLLTALTTALIASSVAFAAVNAAENVTPSDVSPTDSSAVTREVGPVEMQDPPENLGDTAVTMTTAAATGSTISLGITGTDVYIDKGDGAPASYGNLNGLSVSFQTAGNTIRLYGDITVLDCGINQLTALDVSHNTDLWYLSCNNNQLTTLDVSNNTALTYLCCYDNQLTTLNVSGFTALTDLRCGINQLTTLNVSGCTALTKLSCYDNELTSLDVSHNTALTDLDCSANQLTTLNVSNNTALTGLGCYENQLTALDVSKNTALTGLYCSENQLTTLNVSNNTALTDLSCGSNQLTALNVSKNTALMGLRCDSNQLTTLNVSNNTALEYLDCERNHLTALNVSNNTALEVLYCNGNQLTALDVSNNTALTDLRCEFNQLTSLDVSNNTDLGKLYCNGNQLTALDVSNHTVLWHLYCNGNQLTALDVSGCTFLMELDCGGNQLTTLDVSHNTDLRYLVCMENQLTTLDVSHNTDLTYLYCYGNHLTMQTIYGFNAGNSLTEFQYAPQTHVIPASVSVGGEVDLSSEYSVDGVATEFTWYDSHGNVVTPATSNGGVFTFGENAAGKTLVCKMTNAKLPDFNGDNRLTTTEVTIEGASVNSDPVATMTTAAATGSTISLGITGTDVYIDIGDGNPVSYGDLQYDMPFYNVSFETAGNTIRLYGNITVLNCESNQQFTSLNVSGCAALTELYCRGNQLTALDVSNNTALETLWCGNNQLTALDVSNNTALTNLVCESNQLTALDVSNNTALTWLGCYENQLTSLDLSKNTALTGLECGNNQLTTLDVSNNTALTRRLRCESNQLTALDVSNNTALTELWCDSNQLTALDVSNNTALTELNCSWNQLTALDLSKNTALTELNCGGNQLTTLDVSNNTALEVLYCSGNQLTMQTIYGINAGNSLREFQYAPQTHVIPASVSVGGEVDLSSEYSVDGVATEFTWYDSHGNVVTPATSNGGVFTFGENAAGKTLVCEMTNAKLPDFRTGTYSYSYEEYDEDGNPTSNTVTYEYDIRLTTTEIRVISEDSQFVTVKAGVSISLAEMLSDPESFSGKIAWSSSNTKAAVVDAKGVLRAVAEGMSTVKARCGGSVATFVVNVEKAVALNKYSLSFMRNTAKSNPIASLSAKKPADPYFGKIVWYSDNPSVATVSDRGAVKAVGAGVANIYCDSENGGSVSAPCVVTVEDFFIAGESMRGKEAFVLAGETTALTLENSNHGAITWKSSDSRIASLDGGVVTAKKKGTVTVTAYSADKKASDSIKLTVVQPTESISVTGVPQNFYVGSMVQLRPALTKGSNDKIFWSSADESVATVDATGKVRGIAQGETTITAATFGGKTCQVNVTVRTKAAAISWTTVQPDMTVSKTVKFGIAAGGTLELGVSIDSPADCNDSFVWSTSNRKVATVQPSVDGRSATVTGIAKGTAVITAKTGSGRIVTATVSVVTVPATQITVNRKNVSLYAGSAVALSAKLQPKGCNDAIIWRSSDPSIATVNESGSVRAVSAGTATITAYSSANGEIKDTAEVTVRTKAVDFRWTNGNPGSIISKELRKGIEPSQTCVLSVAITSPSACNDTITWSTSNAKIAKVAPESDGRTAVITGVAKGVAVITAKTGSGRKLTARIAVVSVPANGITMAKKDVSVYMGSSVNLSLKLQPKGCNDMILWSIDDPSVATVNENGTVTGIAQGTATVTAYSAISGEIKDTADIVVRNKAKQLVWAGVSPGTVITKELKKWVTLSGTGYLSVDMIADETCNDTITWSTSNARVAKVTPESDGRTASVTGVAKGVAVITVKTGSGKKLTARVTVGNVPAAEINIKKRNVSVYAGSTVSLSAAAQKGSDDVILWSTSDAGIATVNENGVVSGISQGTATITAYSSDNGEIKDTAEVTVRTKAKTFAWISDESGSVISKEYRTGVAVSESRTLNVEITSPDDCNDTIAWSTGNARVATVTPSADGRSATVTGVAKGVAIITAKTGSGKKLTARISVVTVPATAISIKNKNVSVYNGSTVKLAAAAQKGSNDVIRWRSSDPAVATVDEDGVVRGISQGTATITAYSSMNGEISDTAEVTVRTKAKTMKLDATDANLTIGEEECVYADITPNESNDIVTCSISNSKVATVRVSEDDSRSFIIRGLAKGSAVVTIRTGSGLKATVKVVVVG